MNVYEAMVKGLECVGVDTVFGIGGENVASLMLALDRSEQIRTIMTRHEQAASFMACGYAMYTNRLGVCYATVGPGAFNLFTGLGVAMSDSYPVLAITGYVSLDWIGMGAVNDTSGVRRTPDSQAMFAATTKKSFLLTDVSQTCDVLEEAVNLAHEGRPGPVHIHVPQNLTFRGHPVENYRDISLTLRQVRPDPATVEAIADALMRALGQGKSVVVLSGCGAVQSGADAEIKRFIEQFQLPIVTTLDGKGIVAEDHPLAAGVFSESGHSSAWKTFLDADVVVAVGNSFNQHATFNFRPDLLTGKTLIHINISEDEIGKFYKPDHALVSDARLGIAAITDALSRHHPAVARREIGGQDYEERHVFHLPGAAIHPGQMSQMIGRKLPPGGVVLADAGAHLAWLGYYVQLEEGQNFRKTGTFGPMGSHVNAAIGVKVAEPHRTVVVGCGDGCYQLAGFELMTAVENNIPVIWVIFDDRELKLIKLYQLATYGRTGLVEFQNPDFAAYARACGADGYRVETIDEFEQAFDEALASGRPTLIDAKISRLALPHYSPSPEGIVAGIKEMITERFFGHDG